MPRVSLIVSTLGRTTQLTRLLDSLRDQEFSDFEIIVVDQNPDNRLAAVLQPHTGALNIVHVTSTLGVSRGRNTGLEIARGEVFAFPDDDCWYPRPTLRRVVDIFDAEKDLDLVSGRTVDAAFNESLSLHCKARQLISRHNIWRIGNSNTIFVRARPNLYFDETLGIGCATQFQSGEETDFLLRLLEAQARLQFDPSLLVHHDQIDLRDDNQSLRRARLYSPGQGRVLRLNKFGAHHAAWLTLRPLARACVAAAHGDIVLARYKLAWAQGLARGYFAAVRASKPNTSVRIA